MLSIVTLRGGLLCLVTLMVASGCAKESESLFEHDHELPPHWPVSMSDAAEKIAQRLPLVTGEDEAAKHARKELRDLVEWAPEIAADTDLEETDWLPIYNVSEALRMHLADGQANVEDFQEDFERLVSLLQTSHQQLQLNSNGSSSEQVR